MSIRKSFFTVMIVALFVAVIAFAGKPWFDNANCDFCKNLTAEKGLMEHITKWEHHNVKNGAVTITVVDHEYIPAYKRAMARMEEVGKRMQAGEKVRTCGMCDAYSSIYAKGAQWDVVESGNMFISLLWSDKPEVVREIHEMIDHTNKEMSMMGDMKKHDMKKPEKKKDMPKDHDHR